MISDITGIILAGGKSARMGEDKSFLELSGKTLIENVIDSLSPLSKKLLIITNTPRRYQRYGIETRADIIKERGPLGGICTGLIFSDERYNFVVACDMPFIDRDLAQYMIGQCEGYDAVIAEQRGMLQPLLAVYSKNCIEPMKKELLKNNLKLGDLLKRIRARVVDEKEISRFDPEGLSFVNINTPEDYEKVKHITRSELKRCHNQSAAG